MIKSIRIRKQDTVEDCCWIWFLILQRPSRDKIKQREQSVLEKWGKDVSWRRTFIKLREHVQKRIKQAKRMQDSESSLRGQISLVSKYSRWSLKKQSTKTKEHFLSSKSGFIDRHKSNDRQGPKFSKKSVSRPCCKKSSTLTSFFPRSISYLAILVK